MPKKTDEQLLAEIEKIYISDNLQTYSSLAAKFQIGLSTIERIAKQRDWSGKRNKQSVGSEKMIEKSEFIVESLQKIDFAEFDEFSSRRLLRSVRKSLVIFEVAIDQNSDNPRALTSLVGGLTKLVELHLKLQPVSMNDLVEMAIEANVTPDNFFAQFRQEKERLN